MRQCLIDFCYCQKAVAVYRNCEAALRFLDFSFADITEKSSLLSWKYMNTVGILTLELGCCSYVQIHINLVIFTFCYFPVFCNTSYTACHVWVGDWCLPTVNHFGTPGFLGSPDALEAGFEGFGLDGPGLESVPVEVDVSSLERLIQNIESYIMFSTTPMHEHVKVNEYVKEHMIPVMFNVITQIHVHV